MITAIGKVRRAFDVGTPAQEAALASLGDEPELARRRALNREAMSSLVAVLRERGLRPGRPCGGELRLRRGRRTRLPSATALLRRGVIVRPMGPFGAPGALRITAGTPDEIAFLAEALRRVKSA